MRMRQSNYWQPILLVCRMCELCEGETHKIQMFAFLLRTKQAKSTTQILAITITVTEMVSHYHSKWKGTILRRIKGALDGGNQLLGAR